MRRLFLAFLTGCMLMAAAQAPIPLFPNGAPGYKPEAKVEQDMTTEKDNMVMGRRVMRLGNVTQPALTFYPASAAKNTGATVVVFPGGGYRILAYDLEGTEVCEWLNSVGINAVLVKYRVPEQAGIPRFQFPLQDAQRAIRYTRSHAEEWKLAQHRIGVLGFSAGGHVAALASTSFARRIYEAQDAVDQISCRPDFAILIYPAYLATGPGLNLLAPEAQVPPDAPPVFLVQTEDDPVHVESSLIFYQALKQQKIPAELHLYATGGHGYGLRSDPQKPVTLWPGLVEAWLTSRGVIARN